MLRKVYFTLPHIVPMREDVVWPGPIPGILPLQYKLVEEGETTVVTDAEKLARLRELFGDPTLGLEKD